MLVWLVVKKDINYYGRGIYNWVFGVYWSRDGERLVAVGAFKGVTVF